MESVALSYHALSEVEIDDVVEWRFRLWVVAGIDTFGYLHLWPYRDGYFVSGAPIVHWRSVRVLREPLGD